MVWEIVEPAAGPSIYAELLGRHGDGVQRLAFNCDGLAFEERLREFSERGFEPIQTGLYLRAVPIHMFGIDDRTIIEIYHVPSDFRLPEPEDWYPGPPPGCSKSDQLAPGRGRA